MTVLAANNLQQVNKELIKAFNAGASLRTPVFPMIYNIGVPTRKDEKYQIVKLDNTVSEVSDGGAFVPSDITEIGGVTITQKIYKQSVPLGDFSEVFDNYGMIMQAAREKGDDFTYQMDSTSAAHFNNPTSTTAPYGFIVDGTSTKTSLLADTQPVGDTGSTQDNNVATAYSKTVFNSARTLLREMKRHNGNIAGYNPARVLCPVELTMDIWEDTQSPVGPTGDNNKNYVNSLNIQVIEWDLLTSATKAFLMAEKTRTRFEFLVKIRPTMKTIRRQNTDNLEFQIKAMWNVGLVDYQGLVGMGT